MKDDRKAGWAERAVNKVVKLAISRLVEAEQIDVWVRTTLSQAMQGHVDAIAIHLKGFLMRQDLQMETFQLQIDQVAVVPKLAVRGTIQLIQPATAELIITLQENQLSNFLRICFANEPSSFSVLPDHSLQHYEIDQINSTFLPGSQLQISLNWTTASAQLMKSSILLATPEITSDGDAVHLVVQSTSGHELPVELVTTILSTINEILSLHDIKQQGTSFQIQHLDMTTERLTLRAAAVIHQFPS